MSEPAQEGEAGEEGGRRLAQVVNSKLVELAGPAGACGLLRTCKATRDAVLSKAARVKLRIWPSPDAQSPPTPAFPAYTTAAARTVGCTALTASDLDLTINPVTANMLFKSSTVATTECGELLLASAYYVNRRLTNITSLSLMNLALDTLLPDFLTVCPCLKTLHLASCSFPAGTPKDMLVYAHRFPLGSQPSHGQLTHLTLHEPEFFRPSENLQRLRDAVIKGTARPADAVGQYRDHVLQIKELPSLTSLELRTDREHCTEWAERAFQVLLPAFGAQLKHLTIGAVSNPRLAFKCVTTLRCLALTTKPTSAAIPSQARSKAPSPSSSQPTTQATSQPAAQPAAQPTARPTTKPTLQPLLPGLTHLDLGCTGWVIDQQAAVALTSRCKSLTHLTVMEFGLTSSVYAPWQSVTITCRHNELHLPSLGHLVLTQLVGPITISPPACAGAVRPPACIGAVSPACAGLSGQLAEPITITPPACAAEAVSPACAGAVPPACTGAVPPACTAGVPQQLLLEQEARPEVLRLNFSNLRVGCTGDKEEQAVLDAIASIQDMGLTFKLAPGEAGLHVAIESTSPKVWDATLDLLAGQVVTLELYHNTTLDEDLMSVLVTHLAHSLSHLVVVDLEKVNLEVWQHILPRLTKLTRLTLLGSAEGMPPLCARDLLVHLDRPLVLQVSEASKVWLQAGMDLLAGQPVVRDQLVTVHYHCTSSTTDIPPSPIDPAASDPAAPSAGAVEVGEQPSTSGAEGEQG